MLRPLMRLTALYAVPGVDLTRIHGLGPSLALKLAGEWGTNLSAWPRSKHFTSWPCLAPGNKISGGKVLSSRTRRSGSRAAAPPRLAAATAGRTGTAPGAFYRRLSRVGKAKAVTAPARKIAVLFYTAYAMAWITAIPAPLTTRSATAGKSCPICSSGRRPLVTSCKRPA